MGCAVIYKGQKFDKAEIEDHLLQFGRAKTAPKAAIAADATFRTLDYGENKGQPEDKAAQQVIKDQIVNDEPLGKTGEKFSGFLGRVIPGFKNALDTEGHNTVVVTHSSVIKALQVWEEMGRPDVAELTGDKLKDFAQKYVELKPEAEGKVHTFKGDNGNDIHVVRHGETEDNKLSEFRDNDTQLTDKGQVQADNAGDKLKEVLKGNQPPKIITSDLPRTLETTNIIHNKLQDNATSIRSDQGQGSPAGDAAQSGQDKSGQNIQLPAGQKTVTPEAIQPAGQTEPGQVAGPPEVDLPFQNEAGDESITGIRNSVTAQKIDEAGLNPVLQEAARKHADVWQEALKKVKKGYDPQNLIDQLKKKPRPLTDLENALLLIHQVAKEADLDAANREINAASERGDDAAIAEAKLRRAKVKDDLQDLYNVDKAVGTANARGLSARQMLSDRTYSLVNMEMAARASQDGKALTEQQSAQIQDLYDKIKETQAAYEKRLADIQEENKKKVTESIEKKLQRENKKEVVKEKVEKIKKDISASFDELRKISRNQGLSANPLPVEAIPVIGKIAKQLVQLGVTKIEAIATNIYDNLKDHYEGLTLDHVMEAVEAANNKERLDAFKKRTGKSIDEIQNKLSNQDFTKAPKSKPIILDDQAIKLKAANERAKAAFDEGMRKQEEANRTTGQKMQDTFVKWERAFKLSGITTLAKLGMAGATRLTTTPLENVVGEALRRGLPEVSKRATIQGGGFNVKAEAKALTSAFTKGMKDSYDILSKSKGNKSDIEAVFGKKGMPSPEAIDFFGHLHSAIKAPIKRAAFERALYKQMESNIKLGVDVSDPLVQSKIALRAYKESQRAIFMQDNFISDGYRNFVNSLEKSSKYPVQGKAAATALQWLIPFVKVPTNIVGEVGTHVAGVPIGAAKILHAAFTGGLKNLSEDEADMIMRNLKKGSIGAGALALGYFNPTQFGGYYQQGEKRKEGDLKAGEAKVFGHTIPVWLLESPIFQTMQLGATIRRVADTKIKDVPKGITTGIMAGAMGLAEHEPLIDQPARIMDAIKSEKERQYFLDELAKSTLEPALLQNVATFTDKAGTRSPTTLKEHLEAGLPGLRENVPEKKLKPSAGDRK